MGGDCDDTEPAAYPGNPEVCDGVDNDCDGHVDLAFQVGPSGDWTTLQGALNAMPPDGAACVDAGTYAENVVSAGTSLTLYGAAAGGTIVDGGGGQILDLGQGETLTLSGMALTNGTSNQGGVAHVSGGSTLRLEHVEIDDAGCERAGACHGGVFSVDHSILELDHVVMDGLATTTTGTVTGGVIAADASQLILREVTVRNATLRNTGDDVVWRGGFLYDHDSTVVAQGVSFVDNTLWAGGVLLGLFAYSTDSDAVWADVQVSGNLADATTHSSGDVYGGLWLLQGTSGDVVVDNARFQDNIVRVSDTARGAVFCDSCGSVRFTNTLFTDNLIETLGLQSGSMAHGLAFAYNGTVALQNCDVTYNEYVGFDHVYGALGYRSWSGVFEVLNTTITGNQTTDVGAAHASTLFSSYANDAGDGALLWAYSNSAGNWAATEHGFDWYDAGSAGDWTQFQGHLSADPLYTDPANGDYTLAPDSPAIDAGDPALLDSDGTTSDIGAHGGPGSDL